MFTKDSFFDPCNLAIDYIFYSNKELWGKIFMNPVPVSFSVKTGIKINLSMFFKVESVSLETKKCTKICTRIVFLDKYFSVEPLIQAHAFRSLCNFLIRFHKSLICCYVYVPNHPDISPVLKYSPMVLGQDDPFIPTMNKDQDKLHLTLIEPLFYDLYMYCFGKEYIPKRNEIGFSIDFPFSCIRGCILHY
jgi:hypothetical protein